MHLKRFPKGASAICTYLFFDILSTKQSNHPAARARRLLVQADNCVGENKNKYVFAFLALLVLYGWYDEVEADFLIVGHTHDDVDSMFGTVKLPFFKEGEPCSETSLNLSCAVGFVLTLGDMVAFLDKWFPTDDGRPIIAAVENAIDFKSVVSPHISKYEGHKEPHAFRFKLCDSNGVRFVGMQYRRYASEETKPWLGHNGSTADGDAIPVFTSLPTTTGPLPLFEMPVMLPSTLATDVDRLQHWLDHADSLIERDGPDMKAKQSVEWFRSVLATKTLVTTPAADSPGIGSAATLRAPWFQRDPAVRSVCAEGKFTLPTLCTAPAAVAKPPWADDVKTFVISLPPDPKKDAKKHRTSGPRKKKQRPKGMPWADTATDLQSAAPAASTGSGDGLSASAGAVAEPAPEHTRQRKRKSSSKAASSDGERKERKGLSGRDAAQSESTAKRQRSESQAAGSEMDVEGDVELFSTLSFEDVKRLKHVDVVARVSNRAENVWRVGKLQPNEDTKTFTVTLYQLPELTLHDVTPNRLRKPSSLVATT